MNYFIRFSFLTAFKNVLQSSEIFEKSIVVDIKNSKWPTDEVIESIKELALENLKKNPDAEFYVFQVKEIISISKI